MARNGSMRARVRFGRGALGAGTEPPSEPASDPVHRGADAVVGDCGIYEKGHRRPGRVPLDEAAATAGTTTASFAWVGLQQPSAEDIAEVAATFALPPLAVQDAIRAHQRPKLEVYGDVVFAVLKPVRYVGHVEVVDVTELAIFLGPGFAVTVRHGDSDVLSRVRTEFETPDPDLSDFGPTAVLYRAADLVVDDYEDAVEHIIADIDDVESQVFGDGDADHSARIYNLKREVAEFRRAVLPLARPMERLAHGEVPQLATASAPYFRDVHDHVLRSADSIEGLDRLLTDVLTANVARVTTAQSRIALRQNEDMRRISAWAAIALVPTAIAGVYGMNFENMPELRWQYGYFAVLGVIVGACTLLYRAFRHNGWL